MPSTNPSSAIWPLEAIVAIHEGAGLKALALAPVATNEDPFVERRLVDGNGGADEIVTLFRPAGIRPLTYPAALPYLPHRSVWTTESPSGEVAPGARWLCQDPAVVLSALQHECAAAGWVPTTAPTGSMGAATVRASFARGPMRRLLIGGDAGGVAVIQLLDIPGTGAHGSA